MDEVFKALADPSRRALLDGLNRRNGQSLRELCAGLDMARQSVSKHLAVLESANLVTTTWRGREKLHFLNPEPINAIADRWINQYHRERVLALADLKTALEETPMSTTEFVYTTYINTTPERLWQALTDPAFTRRYWGATFDTDWRAGSPYSWEYRGHRLTGDGQVILESDPYRRLSYSWPYHTAEFSAAVGIDPETHEKMSREPRSKVSFDIVDLAGQVKLTVVHDGFGGPESAMLRSISGGWPAVLSNLKTLLETGDVLPTGPAER